MKTVIAVLALCVTGQAWFVSPARAEMEGSAHDLRGPDSTSTEAGAAKQICVFCHTPAGGESAPAVPRWNPQSEDSGFERQATFGNPGIEQLASDAGPVSLTCFACHDGTQASDAGTVMDLGSSHPVSIPYASGVCSGVEADCELESSRHRGVSFNSARFDVINSVKSWWIDTSEGLPGRRDRSDIILYPREDRGAIGPAVECGSCHDPHDGRRRPVSFLRVDASGSSLCMACHVL